jgi:DNA-binding Lrp family transcriptional regulator
MEDIEVAVLHLLRTEKHAKSSNAAIAKLVGISAPTAGKIVKRLVGSGAVDPREDVVDSKGRPVAKKAPRPVRVKVDGEETDEVPEAVLELAKKGRIPDGTVVNVTTIPATPDPAEEESGFEGEEFDIDAAISESECGQLLTGEAADRFGVDARAFLDPEVQDILERMDRIDPKMQRFYTQARKKKEGQNKKLPPFLMRWNMVRSIKPFGAWKVCDGCEGAGVVFGKGDCDRCKGAGWRP